MSYAIDNLRKMPFAAIIGQPLRAVVEAQEFAALSTIKFIQAVGLNSDSEDNLLLTDTTKDAEMGDVRNVTFKYKRRNVTDAGATTVDTITLSVPILTIVPIPFIRIASTNIDFQMKISEAIRSSTAKDVSNEFNIGAKYNKVGLINISGSYARTSTKSNRSETALSTTADLGVKIQAVQEEMPAGLSRVLDILEATITEKITESKTEPAAP